jgi:hypothetical protein
MSGDEKRASKQRATVIHTPFLDPRAHIRLMRLNNKKNTRSINATLETWDIDSAPPYNAISYVWGKPSDQRAITVNGILLLVRENCFRALKQTRLHYPNDHIWIDAICINQLDLQEKSAQVTIMGGIYANAALVLASVGRSSALLRTAHEMYGTAIFRDGVLEDGDVTTTPFSWYPEDHARNDVLFTCDRLESRLVTRFLSEWNALSTKPYFRRAWIVQEMTGGKDRTIILCGQYTIHWTRLMLLGWRLTKLFFNPITQISVPKLDSTLPQLNKMIRSNDRRLTTYLAQMYDMDCQDVRDRVFSVLSLVEWGFHEALPLLPDYNMSLHRLASELMWRLDEMHTSHVNPIVIALDLGKEPTQVLEHLQNGGLAFCPDISLPDTSQQWLSSVAGAHVVYLDVKGRYQIAIQRPLAKATRFGCNLWPFQPSEIELATSDIVPLHAGDSLVGFGRGKLRSGDILIFDSGLDLVVRARSDASTFSVVGGAYVSPMFEVWTRDMRDAKSCECWPMSYHEFPPLRVEIMFEATRGEVLADRVARNAVAFHTLHVKAYLERHAIGTLRAGSHIRDVTAPTWPQHEYSVIGPPEPLCSAHRSSELHRIQGNALWYIVLSGNGGSIRVHDPG